MKREWRKDDSVPGRWHMRWLVFYVRWTKSGVWSVTITEGETGRDETKTKDRFADLSEAMAVADAIGEDLLSEGWTRYR